MRFVAVLVMALCGACVVEPVGSPAADELLGCFGMQPMCGVGMHAVCICGPIGDGCSWVCTRN